MGTCKRWLAQRSYADAVGTLLLIVGLLALPSVERYHSRSGVRNACQPTGHFDPRVQTELVEHVGDVCLNGPLGDEQPRRDVATRQLVRDQACNLQLALRQTDARLTLDVRRGCGR